MCQKQINSAYGYLLGLMVEVGFLPSTKRVKDIYKTIYVCGSIYITKTTIFFEMAVFEMFCLHLKVIYILDGGFAMDDGSSCVGAVGVGDNAVFVGCFRRVGKGRGCALRVFSGATLGIDFIFHHADNRRGGRLIIKGTVLRSIACVIFDVLVFVHKKKTSFSRVFPGKEVFIRALGSAIFYQGLNSIPRSFRIASV